ncbi:hypothetical protein GTG28_16760 [Vibrio sp. OCN044]|uniref:GHMP kinase N-terminal domain-containing protein n=1 Tax=Vibrio tetraodonis subsp. pristinus TaxID=2695891 RepID=A0A6L8M1B2_9VIBR|nr:kinase [Vibrio tetraodonis]MYM60880.1 hypothetical protein [Vibrio tetraodonis subsp. pristinus]
MLGLDSIYNTQEVDISTRGLQNDKYPQSTSTYGSFGELLQGELPGINNSFLVTCPVNLCSRVTFYPNNTSNNVFVFPNDKVKVKQAINLYEKKINLKFSGILIFSSDIPTGKGIASSTADIISALRAISQSLKKDISPQDIESILINIEPSDGIMYDRAVIYNHRKVSLIKKLRALPGMFILAIDQGGEIDTVRFNSCYKEYTNDEKKCFALLLSDLEHSISKKDITKLGEVSTVSASINQNRSPKLHFDFVKSLAEDICSPGIICAHSGTMLGIILSNKNEELGRQVAFSAAEIESRGFKSQLISTV